MTKPTTPCGEEDCEPYMKEPYRSYYAPLSNDWKMPKDVDGLISLLNTHGGTCYQEHADLIRAFLAHQSESKDATRWQFCMQHGFPKACFNPEREVHYFYVRADCCDDTAFGWDTPEKAVDATMQIMKERDEANARWRQETRT